MVARPSAFFHQVSSASRIRVPRACMAKSTMLVVPPNAAARVPVSKSSVDTMSPRGMSRCVWASMPPGITYMPLASIACSAGFAGSLGPTSVMRPLSIRTSAALVSRAVTTVPFRIRVFTLFLLKQYGAHAPLADPAGTSYSGVTRDKAVVCCSTTVVCPDNESNISIVGSTEQTPDTGVPGVTVVPTADELTKAARTVPRISLRPDVVSISVRSMSKWTAAPCATVAVPVFTDLPASL